MGTKDDEFRQPNCYEDELVTLRPLIASILRRWRSRVDSDFYKDLCQIARFAAWRALNNYDPQRQVQRHIFVSCCVRHAVLDAVRAYTHDHDNVVSLDEVVTAHGVRVSRDQGDISTPDIWSPESFVLSLDDETLASAFRRLGTNEQEILTCSYGREQSDAEIATRFGAKTETIKKRRQRALRRLRSALYAGGDRN